MDRRSHIKIKWPPFIVKEVTNMIIYISTEERINLLDNLAEQYEWDYTAEIFNKNSLSAYINKKLQIIADLPYIVIERSSVKESDKELQDILDSMRMMWDTHIILLEEELLDGDGESLNVIYEEHQTLLNIHQNNLSDKLDYILRGERIPHEDLYDGIWIGIMSSNSGAGTTDASIGLANFIARNNGKVCYVEANESGDLGAMAEYYGMEKVADNHYTKAGVDYWHQSIDSEKKYVVLDLGKYSSTKINLYKQCKIKILISDSKPYRMTDALNVLRLMGDDESIKVWLNFGTDEAFEKIREQYLSQIQQEVFHLSYHEDMFISDDAAYYELMKDYLKINMQAKGFSFLLNKDFLKNMKQKLPEVRRREKSELIVQEEVTTLNPHDDEEYKEAEMTFFENMEEELEEIDVEEVPEIPHQKEIPSEEDEQEYMVNKEGVLPRSPKIDEDIIIPVAEEQEVLKEEIFQVNEVVEEKIEEVLLDDLQTSEIVDEIQELIEDTEPYVVVTSRKKKHIGSTLMLFLLFIVGCFAVNNIMPYVKDFFFNNLVAEATTELTDPELNIDEDIKISVLAVEDADGYEVSYSTDESFDKKRTVVIEVKTADQAIETLAAGKTYYIRVRAFKYNEDGTKVYGEYTEVQKIEM